MAAAIGCRTTTASSGVALLEVLVAVVVISVGLVGVVSVEIAALHALSAPDRWQALSRLEDELVQLRSQAEAEGGMAVGDRQGQWADFHEAAWEASIQADHPHLVAVTLRATWDRAGRPQTVSMATKMLAQDA